MSGGYHMLLNIVVVVTILSSLIGNVQMQLVESGPAPAPAPEAHPALYPFPIAKPDCPDKCGNISIPYPFGIREDCFYDNTRGLDYNYYNLTCDDSYNPPKLTSGAVEVLNISLEGDFRISYSAAYACYDNNGKLENPSFVSNWVDLKRFTLSATKNSLVAMGCDTYVWFKGEKENKTFNAGCMTVCNTEEEVSDSDKLDDESLDNTCSGVGCCKAPIPYGVTNISSTVKSFNNHTLVKGFDKCSVAFVVATDDFTVSTSSIISHKETSFFENLAFPAVYDWKIGTDNCKIAKASGGSNYICKGNSKCIDMTDDEVGYRCQCLPGYRGNPYLDDCQDINECENGNPCDEKADCINTDGNFRCKCHKGFQGNGTKDNPCTADTIIPSLPLVVRIILGVGGGIIFLLVVAFLLYLQHENKRIKRMRGSFFRQNGGHILAEKLTRRDLSINVVTIFTFEELQKATDNFNEINIIGRGGFGMVYRGIITSPNHQVVAIKRSIKVDSNQTDQFVNEVIVLSQLNHKNVVKLLGCCLENEVPLLVYEYIENGTLFDHLHDVMRDSLLTYWDVRLKIAVEIAEVLAYLHSTISIPIIHRDIKSMNILLDKKYTAKVSDFGTSRLVPIDEDHNATMIQGTYGYLDPEYMQTGQLNEKSDVYSFGVVLLELLTREKVISSSRPENERCLTIYFLQKLKENPLFNIHDDKMKMDDGAIEQVKEVANIARRCLKLKGEDRPSMKQIARELDEIRGNGSHPWAINRGQHHEDNEYLLNKTQAYNDNYYTNDTKASSSSHNSLLQLVPMNDGR